MLGVPRATGSASTPRGGRAGRRARRRPPPARRPRARRCRRSGRRRRRTTVGIVLNFEPHHPASDHPLDLEAAALAHDRFNRWYLDPVTGRDYPADAARRLGLAPRRGPRPATWSSSPRRSTSSGVNYYTRSFERSPLLPPLEPERRPGDDRDGLGGLPGRADERPRVRRLADRRPAALRRRERRRPTRRRRATRPATRTASATCAATSPRRRTAIERGRAAARVLRVVAPRQLRVGRRGTPTASASSTSTSRRRSGGSATADGSMRRGGPRRRGPARDRPG